jgi:hypothetical protein
MQFKFCVYNGRSDLKNTVSCMQCKFCVYDGRSGDYVGRKRVWTNSTQLFIPPYRPELYRKHLETQHADQWLHYKSMTISSKKVYFDSKKKRASSIVNFAWKGTDALVITIARIIVDELNAAYTTILMMLLLMELMDPFQRQMQWSCSNWTKITTTTPVAQRI